MEDIQRLGLGERKDRPDCGPLLLESRVPPGDAVELIGGVEAEEIRQRCPLEDVRVDVQVIARQSEACLPIVGEAKFRLESLRSRRTDLDPGRECLTCECLVSLRGYSQRRQQKAGDDEGSPARVSMLKWSGRPRRSARTPSPRQRMPVIPRRPATTATNSKADMASPSNGPDQEPHNLGQHGPGSKLLRADHGVGDQGEGMPGAPSSSAMARRLGRDWEFASSVGGVVRVTRSLYPVPVVTRAGGRATLVVR